MAFRDPPVIASFSIGGFYSGRSGAWRYRAKPVFPAFKCCFAGESRLAGDGHARTVENDIVEGALARAEVDLNLARADVDPGLSRLGLYSSVGDADDEVESQHP